MAKYYNTTRGPLAVTLSGGGSLSIPPKSWIEIAPSDEGSPNLAPLCRKGYLRRSAVLAVDSRPAAIVPAAAQPEPKASEVFLEDSLKAEGGKDGAKVEVKKK